MATSDSELKDEVRGLTDYDSSIITSGEMDTLLSIAKSEIETEVSDGSLDFYSDNRLERSLFWLICLFTKIKTGEYEGMDLAISEVEMNKIPDGDDGSIWLNEFERRLHQYKSLDKTYVASISRTDRSYGDN